MFIPDLSSPGFGGGRRRDQFGRAGLSGQRQGNAANFLAFTLVLASVCKGGVQRNG